MIWAREKKTQQPVLEARWRGGSLGKIVGEGTPCIIILISTMDQLIKSENQCTIKNSISQSGFCGILALGSKDAGQQACLVDAPHYTVSLQSHTKQWLAKSFRKLPKKKNSSLLLNLAFDFSTSSPIPCPLLCVYVCVIKLVNIRTSHLRMVLETLA